MTEQKSSFWREIIESVVLAVILTIVIRVWLITPFFIPTPSMEPTLLVNDRILVNKLSYHFHQPERGDIVVFKFPLDTKRDFIKRVVALEGETIEIRKSVVYIDGRRLEENYLPPDVEVPDYGPAKVPSGHLFVMGDNRNNSEDSRAWGPLNKDLLVGKTFCLYWPLQRIGLVK